MKRLLMMTALLAAGCSKPVETPAAPPRPAPDAVRGKALIEQYSCQACHSVPGIAGPRGMIGPALENFASRPAFANDIPNTAANISKYLQNPQAANPEATMPNLNVPPADANDMTAFLLTLK